MKLFLINLVKVFFLVVGVNSGSTAGLFIGAFAFGLLDSVAAKINFERGVLSASADKVVKEENETNS